MKQQQHIIDGRPEYPGTVTWYDYEILCPECGKWCDDYGEVSTDDDDGDMHYLCNPCGEKVFPS